METNPNKIDHIIDILSDNVTYLLGFIEIWNKSESSIHILRVESSIQDNKLDMVQMANQDIQYKPYHISSVCNNRKMYNYYPISVHAITNIHLLVGNFPNTSLSEYCTVYNADSAWNFINYDRLYSKFLYLKSQPHDKLQRNYNYKDLNICPICRKWFENNEFRFNNLNIKPDSYNPNIYRFMFDEYYGVLDFIG